LTKIALLIVFETVVYRWVVVVLGEEIEEHEKMDGS
jgi:hypothetical protein